MSFLLNCPNCGPRSVYEFRYGGETRNRPSPDAGEAEWTKYIFMRANINGIQKEWWYHRDGCGSWFIAERDTTNNAVNKTIG